MTDLRKAAEMALAALEWSWGGEPLGTKEFEAITALRTALAQDEQVSGDTSDGYHTFNELYDFRKAYNAALFNEWAASGKYSVHKSKRHYDGKECFGGGWFIVVAQLPNGQISNHYEMKDWDKFQLPEADKALFEYDNHTGADVLHRLFSLQPFAQPDNTSDSATHSADSAESFCKQELHNLMSVAGRMALELECLLLDTENLSVVSKWWDTGMEALQAYRHYVWSVTHGKDGEHFCDTHCVHTDHHPDCKLAQPEQEPVIDRRLKVKLGRQYGYALNEHWFYLQPADEYADQALTKHSGISAPPKRKWVGLTDEEIDDLDNFDYDGYSFPNNLARAIEAKLKEKNSG